MSERQPQAVNGCVSALTAPAPSPCPPRRESELAGCELPCAVNIMDLPIRPLNTDGLIEVLVNRAAAGLRTSVCYANAHTANLACSDRRFHRVLCDSDLLYADGASVVWASRWSERRLPERMTAADFFPRFVRRCADRGLSLFLLGGRPGVAAAAAERLCGRIPGLRIAGTHHGYFVEEDTPRVIAAVNLVRPDILAIGLSSPRQEYWLAEHAAALVVPVRWCVGALFDYLAGLERRAPAWLCRIGGEWLFRLLMDPVGKWRRYLIGNPRFVWNVVRWRRSGRIPGPVGTGFRGVGV